MAEQLENWGKMAAFMHMTGRVPAAYADQPGKGYIARYCTLSAGIIGQIWRKISKVYLGSMSRDVDSCSHWLRSLATPRPPSLDGGAIGQQ